MAIPTIEKKDRNQQLIEDYKSGIPLPSMVAKFGISATRIYQILHNHKISRGRKN